MIRQEYICDKKGCPSTDSGGRRFKGPHGWIRLSWFGTYAPSEFCSTACLREWLMDLAPVPDPNKGVVFTCDQCEKEILLRPGEEWPVWIEISLSRVRSPTRKGFCSTPCMTKWLREFTDE